MKFNSASNDPKRLGARKTNQPIKQTTRLLLIQKRLIYYKPNPLNIYTYVCVCVFVYARTQIYKLVKSKNGVLMA